MKWWLVVPLGKELDFTLYIVLHIVCMHATAEKHAACKISFVSGYIFALFTNIGKTIISTLSCMHLQ